jgi:hypothetical protein
VENYVFYLDKNVIQARQVVISLEKNVLYLDENVYQVAQKVFYLETNVFYRENTHFLMEKSWAVGFPLSRDIPQSQAGQSYIDYI